MTPVAEDKHLPLSPTRSPLDDSENLKSFHSYDASPSGAADSPKPDTGLPRFAYDSKFKDPFRARNTHIKVLAFLSAISLMWITFREVRASRSPTTGLENMPEYGISLGCDNPKDHAGLVFTDIAVHPEHGHHFLDILGGAVGTLHILQGNEDIEDVRYEVDIHTNSKALFSAFGLKSSRQEDVFARRDTSRIQITTPSNLYRSCMRYDVKMTLPSRLKSLYIRTSSTTQIKMSPLADISLDQFVISMHGEDKENMLLASNTFRANLSDFQMTHGWLVGSTEIIDKAIITTKLGDAITDLRVSVSSKAGNETAPVELETITGAGRTKLWYDRNGSKRPVVSTHRSWNYAGDMHLDYSKSNFEGQVNIVAKSYEMSGLKQPKRPNWMIVGDGEGVDSLIIASEGWVGLDVGRLPLQD